MLTGPRITKGSALDDANRGRGLWGIAAHLILLLLVTVLPLIGSAIALMWQQQVDHGKRSDERLLESATALSLALDSEFAGRERMLLALAESETLAREALRDFHQRATRTAQQTDALSISLHRPDGTQALNSALPFGVDLPQPLIDEPPVGDNQPPSSDRKAFDAVFSQSRPGNTNLYYSASLRQFVYAVAVPVMRGAEIVYSLHATFSPFSMASLLTEHGKFSKTLAVIFDGNGFLVARASDGARSTGARARLVPAPGNGANEGVETGRLSSDGTDVRFAYKRSLATGWYSVIGFDMADVMAANRKNLGTAIAMVLFGLLVSALFAVALARRIRTGVVRLISAASGSAEPPRPRLIREFAQVEGVLSDMASAHETVTRERERRLVADVQRQDAEASNRRKDLYIATLAHELRNPLAPIRNAIAILKAKGLKEAELEWARAVIDRQTSQMARLLDDLLDVARIAQGKVELRKETLNIVDVVREAVETTRPAVQSANCKVFVNAPARPIWVAGDPVRLAQVLTNLLNNAAKYSGQGSEITVHVGNDDQIVTISVKDNGLGIDAESLPTIFEPFSQATMARGRTQGGLGIGLSLVKALVELHGGSVRAKSQGAGSGAEFIVQLQQAAAPTNEDLRGAHSAQAARITSRLLIVDDNHDAADTIAECLRQAGAKVSVAYDGRTACALAMESPPQIALLDIGMPGMDGCELARQLSALPQKPILIALTGWGQEADRRATSGAGFHWHLTKPVDPEKLLRLLQTVEAGSMPRLRKAVDMGPGESAAPRVATASRHSSPSVRTISD